jgi:CheY-like chemotaxis protein
LSRTSSPSERPLVLLVDDSPDNRELYAEYFAFSGFRVAEAGNGQEGVAAAKRLKPDVVVMDLELPLVDGCEATRRLKSDPSTEGIAVVVLTGHGHEDDRARAIASGCDAFLLKPCLPSDLLAAVKRVRSRS